MTRIRKASLDDAASLPDIERSASAIFQQVASLAWLTDHDVQSVQRHLELIAQGTNWVAADRSNKPIGFLSSEIVHDDLHIWELAVHSQNQGRGIGRALIECVRAWSADHGIRAITLTTFRDLPWNEVFYTSLGFKTLASEDITPRLAGYLASEAEHGLPIGARCAMGLTLG